LKELTSSQTLLTLALTIQECCCLQQQPKTTTVVNLGYVDKYVSSKESPDSGGSHTMGLQNQTLVILPT